MPSVCCSVLQCVAVCCSVKANYSFLHAYVISVLQCVAVCCSVLQCEGRLFFLTCVCHQCVAVCCSVLQCVAVWRPTILSYMRVPSVCLKVFAPPVSIRPTYPFIGVFIFIFVSSDIKIFVPVLQAFFSRNLKSLFTYGVATVSKID